MTTSVMLAFGPVPSRRLGRSVGINSIPPKICTYSCIYCQIGKTFNLQHERRSYYAPEELFAAVRSKTSEAVKRGETIDYLTFVPDGEPTLDINLGTAIERLRKLGFKIAVISNASLIWRPDVRNDLCKADWVSLKIDAASRELWRKINRAHGALGFDEMVQGMLEFATTFTGEFVTETMLVRDVNDSAAEVARIAELIAQLHPQKSYISIPTRPPAEKWVLAPGEDVIAMAYQLFIDKAIVAEYLIGYEGDAFAFTGNVEADLLSITSVHPMRKRAVAEFLAKAGADANWGIIDGLITTGRLVEVVYNGHTFYIRKLPTGKGKTT